MKMTDVQRQFAEDNIRLVYAYAYENKINPRLNEDLIGEFFETYCRAICKYDKNRGEFSTFLYTALDTKRKTIYNYNHRACRYAEKPVLSLNYAPFIEDEENMAMPTGLERDDEEIEDLGIREICDKVRKEIQHTENRGKHNLKIDTATIFDMLINGWTQRGIALKYGLSCQAISQRIQKKIQPVLRKEMEECR